MRYLKVFFSILFLSTLINGDDEFGKDLIVAPIVGEVNSENQEFGPSLSSNGRNLYFYSKRGSNYTDLFKSEWRDGKWGSPVELKILNSPYDDQSPFVNNEEKFVLFSSNRDGSLEFRLATGQMGVSRDLYYSENIDGRWSKPYPLADTINTDQMEENPFVFENHLYFTRYPFGKLGEAKIYRSKIIGNEFMSPEVLPSPINLPGASNIAAVISNNGEYIYFSSNRNGGFGGYDIYRSKIVKNGFAEPENLGSKINTKGDEAYMIINQADNSLVFCRKNPGSNYDIYTARREDGEKEKISVKEEDLALKEKVKTVEIEPNELESITEILKNKKKISLSSIYFDVNSSELLLESLPALSKVSEFLEKNKDIKIKIIGHTDLTGDLEFNKQLSSDRAESVKKFFTKKGIIGTRISIEGKGSSDPIVSDTKPDSNRKNRRTEFEVVE
jgi:outer membrane protein OmpA-like peptidoglycan-associated protein